MPIYKGDTAVHTALESVFNTLLHEWTRPIPSCDLESFFSGMTNYLDAVEVELTQTKRREEALRARVAANDGVAS
jgi:hypothetical protein